LATRYDIGLPTIPAHCEQAYHMFYILLPSLQARQALIAYLKSRQILSAFHYLPLHTSDFGRRFGSKPGDCPVTENISDRLLRLPFYTSMTEADQLCVVDAIREFLAQANFDPAVIPPISNAHETQARVFAKSQKLSLGMSR
jgi:dTDP-4-amino-4,6-dideoxygalactose transaminase